MKNYFSYENLWVFCATAVLSLVFWCFSPYQYIPIWVTAVLFFPLYFVLMACLVIPFKNRGCYRKRIN